MLSVPFNIILRFSESSKLPLTKVKIDKSEIDIELTKEIETTVMNAKSEFLYKVLKPHPSYGMSYPI
jgi:hypothetical protein